jgi:tetraacyldisaccharide 4'-kinase
MPDASGRPGQAWLQRAWYSPRAPWLLVPFALLYRLAVATRGACHATGLLRGGSAGVPVLVVGNISVGGTGKTPLTLWLAERLRGRGFHIGIATRGFGGRARHARMVEAAADPAEFGDEPVLLARRSGCPVCVAASRLDAARLLVAKGCDLVLCDDGLQHLALRRDMEIAVVDAARGLGNGWMLPAGPLREPAQRLGKVDLVVLNGAGSPQLGVPARALVRMSLEPGDAVALVDGRHQGLDEFRGKSVQAYAGIGNPGRFFAMLRARGIACTEHEFPDHHPFVAGDFASGNDPILMTEKDAVKCARFADARMWAVPVTAHLPAPDADRLLGAVFARLPLGGSVRA